MAVEFPGIDLPRGLRGGSVGFDDPGLTGTLLNADYFEPATAQTLYRGNAGWAAFYKGTRSDAALYKGAGTLHA